MVGPSFFAQVGCGLRNRSKARDEASTRREKDRIIMIDYRIECKCDKTRLTRIKGFEREILWQENE